MRTFIISLFTLLTLSTFAQLDPSSPQRLNLDPSLEPFYHGVASGDPLSDAVIIWTRVTTQNAGTLTVNWKMATDTLMNNVVDSGTTTTDASKDYTVKVDVTGLQPYTTYYYQFEYGNFKSLIGRTKTAPVGGIDSLRFAVVSCADYQNGYYNAYGRLAQRSDIDAVLHLGDYIYEYGAGSSVGRDHEPPNEIITLEDYRTRYSHYRLDEDLRQVHQQHPFITVWDDHESTNNSWYGGAENHTPGDEGDWFTRKATAIQVYHEWLPIRQPDVNDDERIWRKFSYGDLLDLHMIDTRLYGRDEQGSGNEADRDMLGQAQMDWLKNNMMNSTAQWQIVGQQVMMSPSAVNTDDAWSGYPATRDTLLEFVEANIDNFVVLTGDVHTSWASDIPADNYDNATNTGSYGVEFVVTSITSSSIPISVPISLIQSIWPNIQYVNTSEKGYLILDINENRVQGDYFYVDQIDTPSDNESFEDAWYVNTGETWLENSGNASVRTQTLPPLAPWTVDNPVAVEEQPELVVVGTYPNPFQTKVVVQYYVEEPNATTVQVMDMTGKEVYRNVLHPNYQGVHYAELNLAALPKGAYILHVQNGEASYRRKMIKAH